MSGFIRNFTYFAMSIAVEDLQRILFYDQDSIGKRPQTRRLLELFFGLDVTGHK